MSIDFAWWKKPPPIVESTEDVLRKFILEPSIPVNDPKPHFCPRVPNVESLYHIPPAPLSTRVVPDRCQETGRIIDFIEVPIENAGSNAKNSMSLQREPGGIDDSSRGSASYFPFWPGGFDEPEKALQLLDIDNTVFEENLKTCPPGFANGMDFGDTRSSTGGVVDLLSVIEQGLDGLDIWDSGNGADGGVDHTRDSNVTQSMGVDESLDESLLTVEKKEEQVLPISEVNTKSSTLAEWAEILDVSKPVADFKTKIPDMAHKYPFELDIFQKQAIIKLEEHNHVFVAAHTSAGKTVVAEYAIALSKKHMTKTIYTSPIKALSNQKYRDFKTTFEDVGLITGDIQIDPTASCLIMTTEILRSMLYCGSDITRDLEYVIFDEVHYITDADRGHVWEEVLILLPDHVCIVMLSATVPNTLEFANWVGKTKQKRVYVVSTPKRPVPLKHYLYTGCGGKSKDDIFLIVDEQSTFLTAGYRKAKEATDAKAAKSANKNVGRPGQFNQKQEQTLWVGLIDHLQKNDKLPVVAFTLSRNRCDNNANALMSCDLTTAREKYHITSFFQLCLQKLKPPDRILPQVIQVQNCLQRGIGIHHSGILPILKEIVEMLFAKGLVKVLFATETFAMGVNMPARTVIFDSTKKYDGQTSRMLQPAEYTQMAGRAGRRGLDQNGTVIIICKMGVPSESDLRNMILGKPMRLESQFRLTYAMILYLLRVELVTVENMMLHSFREFGKRQKLPESKFELSRMEEKISKLSDLSEHLKPLCQFYDAAVNYLSQWNELMPKMFMSKKIANEMKPGRVLIVTHKHHYNKLAVLLTLAQQERNSVRYKVLILDHRIPSLVAENLERGELWHRMLSLSAGNRHFLPEGMGGHSVIQISVGDIVAVTKQTIKCDPVKILQNWDNRQIPRFRDQPPSSSVLDAIAALSEINMAAVNETNKLEILKFQFNLDQLKQNEELKKAREKLDLYIPYTDIADFVHEFAIVFDRKQLEKKLEDLKYQVSYKSLSLYPDYCNKLKVLQELRYIDEMQQVAMKGRVACEMGQNELMITELVLRNILTDLQPAEIAALLSSLVFQAKTDVEPKMTDTLTKARVLFEEVENDIRYVEQMYSVTDILDKDKLNFGLIEVVYEWARNKPFAEIMELTDIKEGIIVRCIQQLNETLCNVKDAARIIGDPVLNSKMEEASNAIKRDIVFAASLYTSSTPIEIEAEAD
ncbi:SKI2 subunit of superkiller complex protein [Toxorhynchites rutilus septentrionalis]|uniref:SKI2 subunit of superkiller complex protein n=1 Tax=Toxorhynchites rutilus septentrionalis TaxID=329112 RepID=UPI0024796426|nr:SKI2 subunit of superkiller complex protein [Toxorhynchites rutilus septentrionalis]